MSDGAGNRKAIAEEKTYASFAPSRRIVDDGRAPDLLTGFPLETDAELRQRLRHPKALLPTPVQLQRICELQGQPIALWEYIRNVVIEAAAKQCDAFGEDGPEDDNADRDCNDTARACAAFVRELAAPIVARAEGHFDGPIPSLR